MVLKWKLGQLVWTDLLPLKHISFSSTHRHSIAGLENCTRPLVFTSASGCRAIENFDISSKN